MTMLTYIASDHALPQLPNPHEKLLSVNQALALGVEVPEILLADSFDRDRPDVILVCDRGVEYNVDTGEVCDGDFDDDFALISTDGMDDIFTEKKHTVYLEWNHWTEGRARRVIDYMRDNLQYTDELEVWHIWMGSGESPLIRSRHISIDDLNPQHIKKLIESDVTEEFYDMPIQYRLVITR